MDDGVHPLSFIQSSINFLHVQKATTIMSASNFVGEVRVHGYVAM